MQTQTIRIRRIPKRSAPRRLARSVRSAAAITTGAAVVAGCGLAVVSAAQRSTARAATALTYYAFDVSAAGPGPSAPGDVQVVNDQLTTTRQSNGNYPIVGRDSGVCVVTRAASQPPGKLLENCVVTAVVPGGSLTLQGIVSFSGRTPDPATLAVTGGTGRFAAAAGTAGVSFTADHKVVTITVK